MTAAVSRTVVVLDAASPSGRRLAESVRGAGFEPREVGRPDEIVPAVQSERALVVAIAFEALFPSPQPLVRALREWIPGARLVVLHEPGSPRLRLGQRLWAVGLVDCLLPRDVSPRSLAPVLRQAFADAWIEAGSGEREPGDVPDINPLSTRIRLLQSLSASFASQSSLEGLLRELHARMPHLLDFDLLEVLVADQRGGRLFLLPGRPVHHDVLWQLAEQCCTAVAPFQDTPYRAEDLVVADAARAPDSEAGQSDEPTAPRDSALLTLPMVLGGELVGCLGVAVRRGAAPSGDARTILRLVSHHLGASIRNALALESAEQASLVDELTGAHNRRYLGRALPAEWRRARRYGLELAVAVIDIDHFKRLNDEHGHLVGDEALRTLAALLRRELRDTDHLVRYGGEEFVAVLPETGAAEAALVLERLRIVVGGQPLARARDGVPVHATFSAGAAALPHFGLGGADELVEMADRALLAAKQTGRDRVCIACEQGFEPVLSGDGPEGPNKRRFPRLTSQIKVRFVQLPELEGRVVTMDSTDIGPGGIAVRGPELHLRKSAYALVQLEEGGRPLLSRIVWTREEGSGQRSAGLQFVQPEEVAADDPRSSTPPAVKPKALVITERTQTRDLVARVLRAAHYDAKLLYDTVEGLGALQLEEFALIVVGDTSMRRDLGGLLGRIRAGTRPGVRIVVINESGDREGAIEAVRRDHLEHLIAGDSTSEEALFATLNKILLGEYFGLEKYLLWGADPSSWVVSTPVEKEEALSGVKRIAKEVRCHPRIADLLVAAVDEMIINALYRPAPAAASERPPAPVTVECGSDGRLLAVAVRDEHGALRYEELLRALGDAMEREREGLAAEATHASLGFRIMLGALSQLAINVSPGACTEVVGIVDLRRTLREHRAAVPSLGYFKKDE